MREKRSYTILGGGAWATALAVMVSQSGHDVCLYARNPDTVDEINTQHKNSAYLPNVRLPQNIKATCDKRAALAHGERVLVVFPAQVLGQVLESFAHLLQGDVPLILCAKGIEQKTGRFMSEVVAHILPKQPLAVLSGPSFAIDVARGLPTAVTLAAQKIQLAKLLSAELSAASFRCYSSDDVLGVEIGGALKNILAIAAGVTVGRGLGASAQAALVTRGFVELRHIATALGGRPQTMMGLSGLGDLMLTCASAQSRNYSYGMALGAGQSTTGMKLAEGVASAPIAQKICHEHHIDAPIIAAVNALLNGEISVDSAMDRLLSRPLKNEN